MTVNLLDHLQEQGYEPRDPYGHEGDWCDLVVSGTGTVRVGIYPHDGHRVDVYAFDKRLNCEWQVNLSPGTPDAVVLAVIEAAEWWLADRRGGPVTPGQAAKAR